MSRWCAEIRDMPSARGGGLHASLAWASVVCDPIHREADAEGQGIFMHLHDPEGNRIELWEHIEP
jgi:hypothetical protein